MNDSNAQPAQSEFSDAGQIRFSNRGGDTSIHLNTDADAAAEAVIRVSGIYTPTENWFVL